MAIFSDQPTDGRSGDGHTPERDSPRVAPQKHGLGVWRVVVWWIVSRPAVFWCVVLPIVFAAIGLCLMVVADKASVASQAYAKTPQFKVWASLMIGLMASLPMVWRVGVDLLHRLGRNLRNVLRAWIFPVVMGVALVVAVAVLSGLWTRGGGSGFYGDRVRIIIFYVLGVTATVPAFLVMWECFSQLDGKRDDIGIDQLLLLRECLLSSLTAVGLLVSVGVLATGAERQAVLAAPKNSAAPFPSAYVLIWGLSFSALLLVNFIPAFRRLTRRANAFIDTTLPILTPDFDGWQDRLQERRDLAGLLQVTSGVKDVITSAVLVAGPLISSAFSLFIPSSP